MKDRFPHSRPAQVPISVQNEILCDTAFAEMLVGIAILTVRCWGSDNCREICRAGKVIGLMMFDIFRMSVGERD